MFEQAHESSEGLRRVFAGEASLVEAERVAAHLTAGCRECWLLASRAIALQKEKGVIGDHGPLRPLIDLYEIEQARLGEWLEAQAQWAEIHPLAPKARRDKVRLTRALHTLSFLEVLLEEAAAASPREGEEYFYLAFLVAAQLPEPKFSGELKNDLCAECLAEIGNARRRLAKWNAARDAIRRGTEYAATGARNGIAEAKVLCVEGVLEDDLGNTEEAAKILRRAANLFESAGQTVLLSRTLTQLAYVLLELDPTESIRAVEKAVPLIPANNLRFLMMAESIKIDCLIALGSVQEALLRFNALSVLHEQFREPFVQLRRRFNAGRLLEHLGRSKKAEALFQEVIAGDLEHGLVKDFFLDLVYLFGFYLRRGQASDAIAVCQRASQELALLDDDEGSDEAARDQMRAVWQSLKEEVKTGNADLGAVLVLKRYIKAHWRAPASEPPSFRPSA